MAQKKKTPRKSDTSKPLVSQDMTLETPEIATGNKPENGVTTPNRPPNWMGRDPITHTQATRAGQRLARMRSGVSLALLRVLRPETIRAHVLKMSRIINSGDPKASIAAFKALYGIAAARPEPRPDGGGSGSGPTFQFVIPAPPGTTRAVANEAIDRAPPAAGKLAAPPLSSSCGPAPQHVPDGAPSPFEHTIPDSGPSEGGGGGDLPPWE